jgi:hypothetical protein
MLSHAGIFLKYASHTNSIGVASGMTLRVIIQTKSGGTGGAEKSAVGSVSGEERRSEKYNTRKREGSAR